MKRGWASIGGDVPKVNKSELLRSHPIRNVYSSFRNMRVVPKDIVAGVKTE